MQRQKLHSLLNLNLISAPARQIINILKTLSCSSKTLKCTSCYSTNKSPYIKDFTKIFSKGYAKPFCLNTGVFRGLKKALFTSAFLISSVVTTMAFSSIVQASTTGTTNSKPIGNKTIGISQIVEHPALDAVRISMLEELKNKGYEEGKNLTVIYENAQGNIATSSQIATKLLGSNMDVGVAISTPSAQGLLYAAQKQGSHIPIVFSAVSDPTAAKLISETYPITGVSDEPNLEGLMELMNKMLPNLKTLGLMYNPAEANSVSTIQRLKKMLEKQGIKPYEVTVNKSSDVAQAMHSIIGKVDALYFPQDNTMVSAIETVASIAQHSSPTLPVILPIFTSDTTLIKRGILAAVGFDYVDIGKTTGRMVTRALNGENVRNIPIQTPEELKAVVNKTLVKKLGLTIPTDLKYSKVQVVD